MATMVTPAAGDTAPAQEVPTPLKVGRAHEIVPVTDDGPEGLSAAQRHARRQGIGGSDVAAVMGLDPHRAPIAVWLDKLGRAEPFAGNAFTRWGNRLEPVVADAYMEDLAAAGAPALALRIGTLADPDAPHRLVTPDRLVVPQLYTDDAMHGLEIKCRGAFQAHQWGESGTDLVPHAVMVQAMWGMAITGFDRWDVAVLLGGNDFRRYTLWRDAEIEAALIDSVDRFWRDHVLADVPPALTGGDAAEYVKRRYPTHDLEVIPAPDVAADAALERLALVRRELDVLEQEKGDLETQLKARIGAHAGLLGTQGHRAMWTAVKGKTVTDWQTLARQRGATAAEIAAHTTTKEPTRQFRFMAAKEA